MGKSRELSRDLRQKIIDAHKKGMGYRIISKEFDLPLSTVGSIIRKYKNSDHSIANLPRSGRPTKLTESSENFITKIVQNNPSVTLGDIQGHLKEAGIDVGKDTISRALKRTGHYYKKLDSDNVKEAKKINDSSDLSFPLCSNVDYSTMNNHLDLAIKFQLLQHHRNFTSELYNRSSELEVNPLKIKLESQDQKDPG